MRTFTFTLSSKYPILCPSFKDKKCWKKNESNSSVKSRDDEEDQDEDDAHHDVNGWRRMGRGAERTAEDDFLSVKSTVI